jgi:hypothetical protein
VGYVNGKQRKRRPRERPAEPITAQTLRELFERRVLRGNLRMPGNAELGQLAGILEYWRQIFLDEQFLLSRRELQVEALAAHKTLTDAISKIAKLDESNFFAAARESAPTGILRYFSERLAESNGVRALAEHISAHPGLAYSPASYGANGWQWLAGVLPEDFINAMKRANPTFAPGIGHTGPIASFIAAVAPLVTGEHPTPASVATQLKSRRKALEDDPR